MFSDAAPIRNSSTRWCMIVMADQDFLTQVTQNHSLLMHFENTVPLQVFKGKNTPKPEFASSHEEADIPIAKCSIICGRNVIACVKILADDTDIFALLTFFYKAGRVTKNSVW